MNTSPAFDFKTLSLNEATDELIGACIRHEWALRLCVGRLPLEYFATDYEARIIFFALYAWLERGEYDPETNVDRLALGFVGLDRNAAGDEPMVSRDVEGWRYYLLEKGSGATGVPAYIEGLLDALDDHNERIADHAQSYKELLAGPFAADVAMEDAIFERIGAAVQRRRALRLQRVVPELPRSVPPADWGDILQRAKQ